MKNLFLLILLAAFQQGFCQKSYISLPQDPITVPAVRESNWLKSSTERALNDPYSSGSLHASAYQFLPYREALTLIAKSQRLSDIVFYWAKPSLIRKINGMDTVSKIHLYLMLTNCIDYLQTLNYDQEERYRQTNPNRFADNAANEFFDTDFKKPYPDVVTDGYRDTKAFLFRRADEGVDKNLMLKYLREMRSFCNVRFAAHIRSVSQEKLYEFNWQSDHYEGDYKEYSKQVYGAAGQGSNMYYLDVAGSYANGAKSGHWKYYSNYSENHFLADDVTFEGGRPLTMVHYDQDDEFSNQNAPQYKLVFKLDFAKKYLEVSTYKDNKFLSSVNTVETSTLNYWDFYDTKRRILSSLSDPGYYRTDAAFNNSSRPPEKPPVEHDPVSHDYVLYDRLKEAGKDHALLIGISDYDNKPKLNNPVADAEFIAGNLQSIYGFKNEIVRNPGKETMMTVLRKYQKMHFADDEQLLIFYSGHGSYETGEHDGYIVPKDGKAAEDDVNHNSWLSYTDLLENVDKIPCRHILIIIDACYSGALELAAQRIKGDNDDRQAMSNTPEKWFRERMQYPARKYITSTTADRESTDGLNHSPFADQLVYALQQYGDAKSHILTDYELFNYLEKLIPAPTEASFKGDEPGSAFIFIMK